MQTQTRLSVWVRVAAIALVALSTACAPPDPEPSEPAAPDAAASPTPSPDVLAAEDLFVELDEGYEYTPARPEVEEQMRANFEQSGGSAIVSEVSLRNVEQGSAPVATVLVIVFNDQATSADLAGVVKGMEQQSGARAKTVDLAGTPALYIGATPKMFAYIGDSYVIAVFGQKKAALEEISTTLFTAAPLA